MSVESQQGTLCLSCGLCCNGSIFSVISLDAEVSGQITFDNLISNDHKALKLPCTNYVGNKCSIYNTSDKPHVCTQFKCQLVTELESGKSSLNACLSHVQEAKSKVEEIKTILKSNGTYDERISLELNVNALHQRSLQLKSDVQITLPLLKHISLKLYFKRYFGVFEKKRIKTKWVRDLLLSVKLKCFQTLTSVIQKST